MNTPPPPTKNIWVTEGKEVTFYSDSQAAVKALHAVTIKTQLVKETVEALNKLGDKLGPIRIRWVKGHDGHNGNIRADDAARLGRELHTSCHPDSPELPKAILHREVEIATTNMWKKVWRREPGY